MFVINMADYFCLLFCVKSVKKTGKSGKIIIYHAKSNGNTLSIALNIGKSVKYTRYLNIKPVIT